ncbi:MAG: hypothetical protein WKF48_02125 [Solirubrobacteraceae bacterium]
MDRSSAVKIAVLVVCFAAGVGIVPLVADGDDEPAGTSASTSPAAAANTATAATQQRTSTKSSTSTSSGDEKKTQTQGKEKKGVAGSARTPTQTAAPLEIAPKEATKRSREQAAKARARGARSCPDVAEKDGGAIDITATGVSCATAGPARRGVQVRHRQRVLRRRSDDSVRVLAEGRLGGDHLHHRGWLGDRRGA